MSSLLKIRIIGIIYGQLLYAPARNNFESLVKFLLRDVCIQLKRRYLTFSNSHNSELGNGGVGMKNVITKLLTPMFYSCARGQASIVKS